MDKKEFLKLEYRTLREEIKEIKSRVFKIMGIGLIGVPAINFLAQTYKIPVLIFALPVIVLVIGLLFLSENHGMMRCGRYIREHIEKEVDGIKGWEHWLNTPDRFKKRSVDMYLFLSFYLLYIIYFIGSSSLSFIYAKQEFGIIWAAVLVGLYVAVGFWSAIFIFQNKLTSTTTSGESLT